MDEEAYRNELRNHFMGQMKNSKLDSCQIYKDHIMRKFQDEDFYQTTGSNKQHSNSNSNAGGDADRALCESAHTSESFRRSAGNSHSSGHKPNKQKSSGHGTRTIHKFRSDDTNAFDMYETDSNLDGHVLGSEGSGKSLKSSKTVVSKKSSHELRKMVKSQCKLHEVIDETLKLMCATEPENHSDELTRRLKEPPTTLQTVVNRCCRSCNEKLQLHNSQKDVMTEIGKGDFLDCRLQPGETLTISVDDVVNSKVINPMIRKLQRMYLNNLKEEMSLMEDLERLPHKVNEVYKATIFKQKE